MRKILLTFFVLLIFFHAESQDSISVTTLREVVVSASRSERPVIEIPRSVTVIPAHVIQTSIYQSLGDLLNAQSGLFVVGTNQTPGTNQNLFMRGTSSNQVAVLVDGVRITDPSTPNSAMDLSEISLANIERIEIIRGSHSTMLGGAAIGGVINLITKKSAKPGFHGDGSWQGGVFGKKAWVSSESMNLNYATSKGIYFNGSVFQQDVKGLDAAERRETSPSFTSDRDDFRKTDASLKAGFKNNKWDAALAYKGSHQYTEIDNGAFSDDDNNYLVFDRRWLQYQGGYEINPGITFSVLGSFSDSERFYENDSSKVNATTYDKAYSTGTYFGKLQTHEAQVNYLKQDFKGVLGAGLYREKMFFDNYFFYNDPDYPFESRTNYDTLDTETTTAYAFAQLGYGIGRFDITAGTRLSNHTTAGSFLTFEINPSFAFGDVLVYGSLSTGFNPPSLYQLYDPNKGFSAYTTRGNADLMPERSVSLEAGVKKQFSSGSFLTLSAYQTKVTDAIEYIYLWNGARAIEDLDFSDDRGDTYINVGEQRAKGVELEGFVQVIPSISIRGNFSMIETGIRVDPGNIDQKHTGGNHVQLYNLGRFLDGEIDQDDLFRRPDFTAFGSLQYKLFEDFSVSASWRYTGKRLDARYDGSLGPYGALAHIDVEAYHLVDLGIGWQASEVINVGLKVENVLDEEYREVVGFQTRGRSLYLKVSARW